MPLITNRPFLQVDPVVAAKIGINEALVLQQIHELSWNSEEKSEDQRYVRKPYKEWRVEFPFWSVDTIIRTIKKLEKAGYIISKREGKKEKSYLVDYDACESVSVYLLPVCASEFSENRTSRDG
ncbi:helix-turn-helix domain-containing protein [Sporosarcina obsidiansis]|uniref:hypothetical protein n=1 Tax=Sporosarcina obsidiansis TaxID=2660748 RepID=UPI00129B1012|nr:hypothetical protein [Sporosarcina obsidiansis]